MLDLAYGSIDILDQQDLLVMGTRGGLIYVLDISDPSNPVLTDSIAHSGSYVRDVALDIAGNLYAVSSSSETLRIYSPGGSWIASTGSDGSFNLTVPEPATLALLTLGSLALLRRRRR
jgi:WD40 repeat protein